MTQFGKQVKKLIASYLDDLEYKYEFDDEDNIFHLNFECEDDGHEFEMMITINDEYNEDQVRVYHLVHGYSLSSEKKASKIARFLMGVNYRQDIQGFQMTIDDEDVTQVVFENLFICENNQVPSEALIEEYFQTAMQSYQTAMDAMDDILKNDMSIEDAWANYYDDDDDDDDDED